MCLVGYHGPKPDHNPNQVRLVGYHGSAPLVDFRYRLGQLLNLRGEKLTEPQARFLKTDPRDSSSCPPSKSLAGTRGGARSSLRRRALTLTLTLTPTLTLTGARRSLRWLISTLYVPKPKPKPDPNEPQFETALCRAIGREAISEYAVAEQTDVESPRYTLYLERAAGEAGDVAATPDAPTALSARLDEALRAESAVYSAWRAKRAIGECEVVVVPEGRFEALRAARLAEGASSQQLKVSRTLRVSQHAELLAGRTQAG